MQSDIVADMRDEEFDVFLEIINRCIAALGAFLDALPVSFTAAIGPISIAATYHKAHDAYVVDRISIAPPDPPDDGEHAAAFDLMLCRVIASQDGLSLMAFERFRAQLAEHEAAPKVVRAAGAQQAPPAYARAATICGRQRGGRPTALNLREMQQPALFADPTAAHVEAGIAQALSQASTASNLLSFISALPVDRIMPAPMDMLRSLALSGGRRGLVIVRHRPGQAGAYEGAYVEN